MERKLQAELLAVETDFQAEADTCGQASGSLLADEMKQHMGFHLLL